MFFIKKYWGVVLIVAVWILVSWCNLSTRFFWIGGDINDIYFLHVYNPFSDSVVWRFNNGYGAPDPGSRIQMLPYFSTITFLKEYVDPIVLQHIYICLVLLGLLFSAYYFFLSFFKQSWKLVFATLLYFSSFSVWQLLYRNLDFVNISLLVGLPLLAKSFILTIENRKIPWLLFMLSAFLFSISFTNPGFTFYSIIFLVIIIPLYSYLKDKDWKVVGKKLLLQFLFVFAIALPAIISWAVYFVTNTNNYDDGWQRGLLTLGSLDSQKDLSRLAYSVRGLNSDNFFQDGFWNNAPYFFLNNRWSLFFLPVVLLQLIPFFILLAGAFLVKNKKILWLILAAFIGIFVYKSAAAPFGFVMESVVKYIPQLSILRNPHQKAAIPFGLLFSLAVVYVLPSLTGIGRAIFKITLPLLIITQIGLYFLPFTHPLQRVKESDIPTEYKEVSHYINSTDSVQTVLLLPDTKRTWFDTNYNYDGYPIVPKLTNKTFYNIEQAAASKDNVLLQSVSQALMNKQDNSVQLLQEAQIDTIILDYHLDPEPRRGIHFDYQGWLSWWREKGDGEYSATTFGNVILLHNPHNIRKLFVEKNSAKLIYYKQIDTYKYEILLDSEQETELVMQTSQSKWWTANAKRVDSANFNHWKVNPGYNKIIVIYEPYYLRQKILFVILILMVFIFISLLLIILFRYVFRKVG